LHHRAALYWRLDDAISRQKTKKETIMELQHIDLKDLKLSPLNVRKNGRLNGDDLVPSIKANGIIQPFLVRSTKGMGFEIIAGQRRYHACLTIAKECSVDPLPCAIMEEGDNAKAIEASLAENIARLPMDEIDQYEAFSSLIKQGQSVEDIAVHFAVTQKLVNQRLAIANLYNPILNAYRDEKIEPATIRLLTMASTKQKKQWFKLFGQGQNPPQWQLKSWLFDGEEISTSNALFNLESYQGTITSDLFGDESYFTDPTVFWEHQSKAIAEIKNELLEDGWQDVILLDVGETWSRWDYSDWSQDKGGKVFIRVKADGEVEIHKGLLLQKDIKRLEKQDTGQDVVSERPELTKSMQNYLNLHRHAAVRTELLNDHGTALRLAVAQIIAGSSLWDISAEPQKGTTEAIAESLNSNKAEDCFLKQRQVIRQLLGMKDKTENTLVYRKNDFGKSHDLNKIFVKLLSLKDDEVMSILTFVVAETLPSGSEVVELLGDLLGVEMDKHWSLDETFFDLLRDKEAINAMLKDVGGKAVADGNLSATAKVQKQVIRDFLDGKRSPQKTDWQPRYMKFPMQGYTKRDASISAVKCGKVLSKLLRAA